MRGASLRLLAAAIVIASAPVSADWEPEGAIRAGAMIEPGEDLNLGGNALVELWESFGPFTLGGMAGIGVLASDDAERSQAFTPAALTLGLRVGPDPVGVHLLLRGGGWGGATNGGLQGGALLGGAAYLEIAVDRTLALGVGLEVWQLFGERNKLLVMPQLSLVWWAGP